MKPVLALLLVLGCSTSSSPDGELACPANVPKDLAPPDGQSLALVLRAEGVQRYTCDGTKWIFVVPEATLFAGAVPAGTHFSGPSWQHTDGSSAVGRKKASVDVDPKSIPWLLLGVSSHNGRPGVFADVSSIQRLDTNGGLAPTTGCDAAHADAKTDVPYTAKYYFYRKVAGGKRCGG